MANIRTSRRSGLVLRGGVNRRQTRWLDVPSANASIGAAQGAILINSLTAVELALRPFTVIRVEMALLLTSDQSAASEFQGAAVGMAVVSDQAVGIGVTAVPTPITDQESDLWFFYKLLKSEFTFASGVGFEQIIHPIHASSRAMRKVEDGSDIVVVVESDIAAVTAGVVVGTGGRVLIKLH